MLQDTNKRCLCSNTLKFIGNLVVDTMVHFILFSTQTAHKTFLKGYHTPVIVVICWSEPLSRLELAPCASGQELERRPPRARSAIGSDRGAHPDGWSRRAAPFLRRSIKANKKQEGRKPQLEPPLLPIRAEQAAKNTQHASTNQGAASHL